MPSPTNAPSRGLQSTEEVLNFASKAVGAIEQSSDVSVSRSPHRVHVLATRSGEKFVAKWFDDSTSYFRSLDALNNHTIPLGSQAPRLIANEDALKALLMTFLPGAVVGEQASRDPVTHLQVGTLLRQFHESSSANPSTQVTRQLATSLSHLAEQVEQDLGPSTVGEVRELGMQLLDLGPTLLRPVHGALRPEHWMVDDDYGVQIFSYSATEYNPWVLDTLELETNYWRYQPELRSAFFTGYGLDPEPADQLILKGFLVESALKGWVEACEPSATKKKRQHAWSALEHTTGSTLF